MKIEHAWFWWEPIGNWLYFFFGIKGSGPYYGFWSGIGSDITEVAILAALYTYVRHHNCYEKGCWRLSFHVTPNGHRLCKTHIKRPLKELTLPEIHSDHTLAA